MIQFSVLFFIIEQYKVMKNDEQTHQHTVQTSLPFNRPSHLACPRWTLDTSNANMALTDSCMMFLFSSHHPSSKHQ